MMRLPVGQSDFAQIIRSQFDLVDKSLFIKEIIDDDQVILITRPRRFGKTLNLSMLKYFFTLEEETKSDKSLFNNLNINQANSDYLQHQNTHPVITLSFKDIKEGSFANAYAGIFDIITDAYHKHRYLLTSHKLSDEQKIVYQSILKQTAAKTKVNNALKNLITYLNEHHDREVVVLIDEYDTPIQSGYLHNYYDDIVNFFRMFFGAALKDNQYLFKAVLTGILRITKENLFSGLNNLVTYSMLEKNYSAYFGFTEPEIKKLLDTTELTHESQNITRWYNGYKIGEETIYNPWSIASYLKEKCLKPYWVNTSDNALIKSLLLNSGATVRNELELLLTGKSIKHLIDSGFVFADLKTSNASTVWNLMFMSGYLKVNACEDTAWGSECTLSIPNLEIRKLYQQIIESWLSGDSGFSWYKTFINSLLQGDMSLFSANLQQIMEQVVSTHDTAKDHETFYHGLLIGLTASLHGNENYELYSNRESGQGRYDYFIISRNPEKLSILMEFKRTEAASLKDTAKAAVKQINLKNYSAAAKQRDIKKLLKIGIAFSGKQFALHTE